MTRRVALCLALALGCGAEDAGDSAPSPAPSEAPVAGAATAVPPAAFHFVDVAAAAGLTAETWCGRPEKPHILESGGTALGLVDVDGDGALDLYLVAGWRLAGETVVDRGRNRLYHNRGDGTFADATATSGADDDGWGTGVAAGDVNGDGHVDLFVTNFGPDALLLNRGDGTFERAPESPSVDGWSAGVALFDADRDGDLDVFIAGYIACTEEEVLGAEPTLDWKDRKVMLGPFGLEGEGNRYFVNEGGGRFREATEEAGLADVGLFYSFAVVALDLDDDLDLDLYVANDSNPNYVYENDGSGHFREVGLWSGAALDRSGMAQAGMGLATGDVNADGRVDLFVTNFSDDASTLYQNRGPMMFEDATRDGGLREPTYAPLSWGTAFADFDLDGHLDLVVVNGHIYPQADDVPESGGYAQPNLVFRGTDGVFRDESATAGPGLAVRRSSRGLAVGDIDGDGDLDLAISNVDAPPSLLRNDSARRGSWLTVDAPGAVRVEITAGGRRQVQHAACGGSFLSVSDPRFHFGLGPAARVEEVAAVWPDGERTVQRDLAANRIVRLER